MNITGNVTFCDDIRTEASGKSILIGVYAEDLIPSFLPQDLHLAFWVKMHGFPAGVHDLICNVIVNDKIQQSANIALNVTLPGRPSNLFLNGVPLRLEEPGSVLLEIECKELGCKFSDSLVIRPVRPTAHAPAPEV